MESPETIVISNDGTQLPVVEVLTGRGFITGKSGSGKSNSAGVLIEELLDGGFPVLLVDTDGEYWGLKEEYEILHLGADEECDMQVGVEHAEKIAQLALDQNIPIILDVSGYLDEDNASELIKEVARSLFTKEKKLKRPFLMLLEEVHEYIPEGGGLDECGQMLVKVAKRGRKHGLGLCGISQRPADVKKDFITQCDWLVWHRLTWENDTAVVRRVLGSSYADQIQSLDDGEAFMMTDWNDEIRQIQFKRKKTFDAGATPGLDEFERPDLKSVSGDILDELEEISETKRKEQSRIDELESTLQKKNEELDDLRDELERAQDVSKLAEQFTTALSRVEGGNSEEIQATVEEIREEKNEEIRRLEEENQSLKAENKKLRERLADLEGRVEAVEQIETFEENLEEAAEAYSRLGDALDLHPEEEQTTRLKKRVQALQEKVEQLKSGEALQGIELEYKEFVQDEAVQEQIERAKRDATSPRYVKGVISCIIESDTPVTYDEIAEHLDISTNSHVATAVNALAKRDVVEKSKRGGKTTVDLKVEAINNIRETSKRRTQAKELMTDL
ncbi:ATP-binding protein [Halogeometricum borinquense]|nr:DUF87 domain-containing protein [Halogeometricum borinquense]